MDINTQTPDLSSVFFYFLTNFYYFSSSWSVLSVNVCHAHCTVHVGLYRVYDITNLLSPEITLAVSVHLFKDSTALLVSLSGGWRFNHPPEALLPFKQMPLLRRARPLFLRPVWLHRQQRMEIMRSNLTRLKLSHIRTPRTGNQQRLNWSFSYNKYGGTIR